MSYAQNGPKEYEYLSGIIERVTYHNEENGFCVLRVKVKGHKDLVTLIGSLPSISPGEYINASGQWHNDREHGLQFKADFVKSLPPNTLEGIEKYLGSGLIKGIGPHFAKKLVRAFKEDVFDVIEQSPERLTELEGIGKKRAKSVCKNWGEQKIIREIMVFLQSNGVSTTKSTRIYKTYGDGAIRIVSENPYQLARDIRGIGFKSADIIAKNLGIEEHSIIRAQAGVHHALMEATNQGHCGVPYDEVVQDTVKILEINQSIVEEAISMEIASETVIDDFLDGQRTIFSPAYFHYEKNIALLLKDLNKGSPIWSNIDIEKAICWAEEKNNITLAASQKLAVQTAIESKVMVITGGPGTGKTTIVNTILKILMAKGTNILLCAPTGRAAKRMSESTGIEAKTLHRLLEIDPANGKFKKNEEEPLSCDCLIIDESSMVDAQLFYALLKAIPKDAALFIVGDVDQLPSVGAGKVLSDIIEADVIPMVRLTQIFRQAETSAIIRNAHQINSGTVPDLRPPQGETDFYFVEADKENIMDKVIKIVKERIPKTFGYHPVKDVQILCPMRRGGSGSQAMNIELQKILNPHSNNGIEKFGQRFAIGDKVMQTVNDYDKDVYNGDVGYITNHDPTEKLITITFEGRDIDYEYTDLDQVTLAYGVTIHKSQGSEYPVVVIPITMQSFMMLKRNLIYTAVTRGKKLVVMVGEKKALAMAVRSNKGLQRYSKLKEWLLAV